MMRRLTALRERVRDGDVPGGQGLGLLREMGFRQFRGRSHGDIAKTELGRRGRRSR